MLANDRYLEHKTFATEAPKEIFLRACPESTSKSITLSLFILFKITIIFLQNMFLARGQNTVKFLGQCVSFNWTSGPSACRKRKQNKVKK